MVITEPSPVQYLHSYFRQVDLHCQLLAAVHIGIVGLLEGSLQLVKLVGGEGGAVSPVFLFVVLLLFHGLWRPLSDVNLPGQVAHSFVTFVISEKASL